MNVLWLVTGKTLGGLKLYPQRNLLDRESALRLWTEANTWFSILTRLATPAIRWVALLGLCAAYLQGGFNKATDFASAIAEMQHFGLSPERPFALAVIALAGFTLMATFVALRFWDIAPPARFMAANAFFEHLSLVGGFLLVAWDDLRERADAGGRPP